MADHEVWKAIPGVNGYEASDKGRVKSLDRWIVDKNGQKRFLRGRILRSCKCATGHHLVHLGGKHLNQYVHRLVMLAFVGEPPDRFQVCHNNGKPADNRLSNLRYDTYLENGRDRVRHGTVARGERTGNSKLTSDQVRDIRQSKLSRRELAQRYAVSKDYIGEIIRRKKWAWLDAENSSQHTRS